MSVLLLLLACRSASPPLPPAMTLTGPGILGMVSPLPAVGCQGASVQVGLWGPTWSTGAPVTARLSPDTDPAADGAPVLWLEFPVQTGLGPTTLALRLQGQEVRLPLGARSGEFDLRLSHAPGLPSAEDVAAARDHADARVAQERQAWADGAFLLKDGADTVGEVRLQGEAAPPMVSVHDLSWLTPAPVQARRRDDGGDLLLQFPVEPSLAGEDGLLRINLLTRAVVVPSGPAPAPGLDRRLGLVPGRLTDAERLAAVQTAVGQAAAQERALLAEQAEAIADAAWRPASQDCLDLDALGTPWTDLMVGYIVRIRPRDEGSGCLLEIEPEILQHRRQFMGTFPEPTKPSPSSP